MNNEEMNESENNFEKFYYAPLHKRLEYFFIYFLERLNQSNEIIESARKINYEGIIKVYRIEFEKLWDKYIIPKHLDLTDLKESFYNILFENILHSLCFALYLGMGQHPLEFYRISINQFLAPFYFQLELTSIIEDNNDSNIILKIKDLIERAKHADKFLIGKRIRPNEIDAINKVINKFLEEKEKGLNPSFRKIAINIARIDLELIHNKEQLRFYRRSLDHFNKTKKK